MKILVIDDDPDIQEVVSLCLELRWPDAELAAAANGREGLEIAAKVAFDCVILDLGLPDIDGLEVCRQIRAFSAVPIIMLTVRDAPQDVTAGLESGANDYLTKPFDAQQLLQHIDAMVKPKP